MMNSFHTSTRRHVAVFLAILPMRLLGSDLDADGVEDPIDVCPNTPLGITVDAEGRPSADLDLDCDVDLGDFASLQINFTSLHDAALLQGNMTGPLPCVAAVSDMDIELRHVVRYRAAESTTSCMLPDPEIAHLTGGCFVTEVYALDTSAEATGISCVFFDLDLGNTSCPLVGTGIMVTDTFAQYQSGGFSGPRRADEVGGCTLDTGVGAGAWVLVATIEAVAPHDSCAAPLSLAHAETDSWLTGSSYPAEVGLGTAFDLSVLCPGVIYDVWPAGGDGFIDASDRSILLLCMGETAPFSERCVQLDWDCNGSIDQLDKDLFDTAWQKGPCAGGIEVSPCQFHCDGMTPDPG